MKRSDGRKADGIDALVHELEELKKQIEASRLASIKEKIERNASALETHTHHLCRLAESRRDALKINQTENIITFSIKRGVFVHDGLESSSLEKESTNFQEELASSGTLVGHSRNGKSIITLVKLPFIEKIPPYTTWIFLDRNQMMAEDQSVFGRRQIYYDPCGNETLICSDSEEDVPETEGEKHNFSEGDDLILWTVIQKHGLVEEVLNQLSQFMDASPAEIQGRYGKLLEKSNSMDEKLEPPGVSEPFSYETLTAALDSFDSIFCRRCLIFDCHLHGCPQTPVIPSENLSSSRPEICNDPCGDLCFMKRKDLREPQSEVGSLTFAAVENSEGSEALLKNSGKRKAGKDFKMEATESPAELIPGYYQKKQKRVLISDAVALVNEDIQRIHIDGSKDPSEGSSRDAREIDELGHGSNKKDESSSNRRCEGRNFLAWSCIEKDLFSKGLEIFGKNSCLIARNLLSGLKSCEEVWQYINNSDCAVTDAKSIIHSCGEDSVIDLNHTEQAPGRTRIWQRRGRSRKLKYTWKSAGHPSSRKRLIDGKSQSCKQYTPCACQPSCGKQCPCLLNGTCCEKYCGCLKCCKNRFRGCHCAKSQCRSRQCPCFAGGRECDPDVCRNCWVSCGDGLPGGPPARGDGYECGNMNLLLKQKQRILLSKSDVAGWGAFIKNPVNKNDYLGEYTGELISHREADKRGKIYDRANSSFLFDLNDQYVLDAYRKGDKLKFANHSSNPNCYAKVMLVAGDHRVGIFAKERIDVGEELFYDYRYGPDQAPAWARKPGAPKRDESVVPHARAQKIA